MEFAHLESKLGEGERKIRANLKEKMIDLAHKYRSELIKHKTYSSASSKYDRTISYYQEELEKSDMRMTQQIEIINKKALSDIEKAEILFLQKQENIKRQYELLMEQAKRSYDLELKLIQDKKEQKLTKITSSSYKEQLQMSLDSKIAEKEEFIKKEPIKLFQIRQEYEKYKNKWNEYAVFGECPVDLPISSNTSSKKSLPSPTPLLQEVEDIPEIKVKSKPLPMIDGVFYTEDEVELMKLRKEQMQIDRDRLAEEAEKKEKDKKERERQRRIEQEIDLKRQREQRRKELEEQLSQSESESESNDLISSLTPVKHFDLEQVNREQLEERKKVHFSDDDESFEETARRLKREKEAYWKQEEERIQKMIEEDYKRFESQAVPLEVPPPALPKAKKPLKRGSNAKGAGVNLYEVPSDD